LTIVTIHDGNNRGIYLLLIYFPLSEAISHRDLGDTETFALETGREFNIGVSLGTPLRAFKTRRSRNRVSSDQEG